VARRIEQTRAAGGERGVVADYAPYFAHALAAAVAATPQVNAAFDAQAPGIRRFSSLHLGVSVADRQGRGRYAVIRDADTRNALGLALELTRAREEGSPNAATLAEATITLADYGPGSALFAVPLVQPGQAAAVRVGAVEERLVTRDRGFAVAPTAFLSASVDHRVLDGVDAGALLGEMKRFLESYPLESES
jgi:2-oxoisovalerate dehydrogenase E2 component (dihydrolipoyl transacylase)